MMQQQEELDEEEYVEKSLPRSKAKQWDPVWGYEEGNSNSLDDFDPIFGSGL